jgi:hypothetical protein
LPAIAKQFFASAWDRANQIQIIKGEKFMEWIDYAWYAYYAFIAIVVLVAGWFAIKDIRENGWRLPTPISAIGWALVLASFSLMGLTMPFPHWIPDPVHEWLYSWYGLTGWHNEFGWFATVLGPGIIGGTLLYINHVRRRKEVIRGLTDVAKMAVNYLRSERLNNQDGLDLIKLVEGFPDSIWENDHEAGLKLIGTNEYELSTWKQMYGWHSWPGRTFRNSELVPARRTFGDNE